MADITNAQVVRFSNERCRTLADTFVHSYYALLSFQSDYSALGIAALLASSSGTDVVVDGSLTDGRIPVTKNSIVNMSATIAQIKTALDTTLVPGVGVSAMAVLNTIQVNGSVR